MRSKCENCGAALVNGVCSRHCTALNPPTMRELWGTVPDLRAPVDDCATENAALRARVARLREALDRIAIAYLPAHINSDHVRMIARYALEADHD